MAEVSWMRPELRSLLTIYQKIRDVLEGSEAMKGRRRVGDSAISGANGWENIGNMRPVAQMRRYLLQPNPLDISPENLLRFRMYVERAQWYGATERTLGGLTGQVFQNAPVTVLPDKLQAMENNVDGAGVTLVQQMNAAVDYGIAYGRGGLLTDFPSTDGAVASDVADSYVPTITLYTPWQITNWRVEQDGSQKVMTLVVLIDDNVFDNTDMFESKPVMQFRVLMMEDDGSHSVQIWRETAATVGKTTFAKKQFEIWDYFQPFDANGTVLTEIPFTFFGAKNNDDKPDKPPMEDIAEVNVGHFRNSADYEDSVHLLGQPTPFASGLTTQWVKEIWGSKKIPLGSRAVIPLPVGGTMGLLEVSPNSLAYEAMKEKEAMMIKLGAKLMEQATGQQTATGELIDETSETSVLSNVANNVAAAYKFAFIKAGLFVGLTIDPKSEDIKIKLNTSFQFTHMSAGDRQELVSEWQKGAISFTEMRNGLRGTGIATQEDAVALDEIKQEQVEAIATGLAFGPAGVDVPPVAAAAAKAIPPAPAGQAPNPKPPVTGAAKVTPAGKK